ncbi:hypothetical protein [Arthrospiribacter ruber]|uniref:Lipocalin-like domain-containing protein n=1 Tax=Arthrospiribacter ruber TaxID=2487934 RepID=A0A951IXP5_9BACT|nr:hypothetical protein [Arthrospiribacter ruber]MBW3467388.1 hypothetical protein [Arthrospiribacter ruber]
MKKIYILFVSLLVLSSCMGTDDMEMVNAEFPLGIWKQSSWKGETFDLEKTVKLSENSFGYIFKADGSLIQRSNAGWCGTPPVVTADYSGKWTLAGDILSIESEFWGGTQLLTWKILRVSNGKASIKFIDSEFIYNE